MCAIDRIVRLSFLTFSAEYIENKQSISLQDGMLNIRGNKCIWYERMGVQDFVKVN